MDTATDEAAKAELSKDIEALIEKLLTDVDEAAKAHGRAFSAFDLIVFVLHALAHEVGRVMTPVEVLDARDTAAYEFDACNRDQVNAVFAGIMENLGLELDLTL